MFPVTYFPAGMFAPTYFAEVGHAPVFERINVTDESDFGPVVTDESSE